MSLKHFSSDTQDGLRLWAKEMLGDVLALDGTAIEYWAWVCFLLRASADRPEWFPRGKWAIIQVLMQRLDEEAAEEIRRDWKRA